MPAKYQCPKCERRYVEWGAEKFGFKCPNCVETELIRIGAIEQTSAKSASLKRRPRKATPSPIPAEEELEVPEFETSAASDGYDEEEVEEEEELEVVVGVGAKVADAIIPGEPEGGLDEVDPDAEVSAEEIDLGEEFEGVADDEVTEEPDFEEP